MINGVALPAAVRNEMKLFNPRLVRKKEATLANKADMRSLRERWEGRVGDRLVDEIGTHRRVALVSAMKGLDLAPVLREMSVSSPRATTIRCRRLLYWAKESYTTIRSRRQLQMLAKMASVIVDRCMRF